MSNSADQKRKAEALAYPEWREDSDRLLEASHAQVKRNHKRIARMRRLVEKRLR